MALLTILALWLCCPSRAASQVTYDGCVDYRGLPVASIMWPGLGDVAKAAYDAQGNPIIYYDPNVLMWLSPATRLFFYTHECGHHALGHLTRWNQAGIEQEADCWAINTLVNDGLIDEDDVRTIQSDIWRFGRADWSHLPGPQRAINLRRCLGLE